MAPPSPFMPSPTAPPRPPLLPSLSLSNCTFSVALEVTAFFRFPPSGSEKLKAAIEGLEGRVREERQDTKKRENV